MTSHRLSESTIDASLDAFLLGAREGDTYQARRLHELLEQMLTEQEIADGQLWLTEHGRTLLAEMHRELSKCEGDEAHLGESVLDAVEIKPRRKSWDDTCSYVHDLRIAISVANELCEQKAVGCKPDVQLAAKALSERGEVDLLPTRICEIYDAIASTVGGFRKFSHC